MQKLTYSIYRNGRTGDGLQHSLKVALEDFYRRYRCLPLEIVVPTTQVDEARAALMALDLARLPVRSGGGCLIPELWLGREEAE